jgi:hypothetical protein
MWNHRQETETTNNYDVSDSNSCILDNGSLSSAIRSVSTESFTTGKPDTLTKKITVRGADIKQVTITYNLDNERRIMRNLVANGHKVIIPRTDKSID